MQSSVFRRTEFSPRDAPVKDKDAQNVAPIVGCPTDRLVASGARFGL